VLAAVACQTHAFRLICVMCDMLQHLSQLWQTQSQPHICPRHHTSLAFHHPYSINFCSHYCLFFSVLHSDEHLFKMSYPSKPSLASIHSNHPVCAWSLSLALNDSGMPFLPPIKCFILTPLKHSIPHQLFLHSTTVSSPQPSVPSSLPSSTPNMRVKQHSSFDII